MEIVPFRDEDAPLWDEFAAGSPAATFLHTRRYLSYHGERFRDASVLVRDEKDALAALFPAAVDPSDSSRVTSHPGVTYGGLLHQGRLGGERMVEALAAVRDFYAGRGFSSLRYKAVPHIYHREPSADDLYALFRLGSRRYRCDLSCAIDLEARREPSSRRRRALKKALARGVEVVEGPHLAAPLWEVVAENLERKHGARPVHTLEEIVRLHGLFSDAVRFVAALLDSRPIAGVVLFVSPRVAHAQYIASSPAGYEASALDAVFEHCVERARRDGLRYFDFGTSNEQEGRVLNADLYRFKSEFGGGGVAHEFYELDLAAPPPA
jgi:hypothetical protein